MENSWKFRHVGLVVKNLDKAVEFYTTLGFTADLPMRDLSFSEGELLVNDKPSTTPIRLKACNLHKDTLTVELIEPVTGDFVHSQTLKTRGEGINHIAFSVADLKTEKTRMVEMGFPFIFGSESFGFFETRSIGNVTIELTQTA